MTKVINILDYYHLYLYHLMIKIKLNFSTYFIDNEFCSRNYTLKQVKIISIFYKLLGHFWKDELSRDKAQKDKHFFSKITSFSLYFFQNFGYFFLNNDDEVLAIEYTQKKNEKFRHLQR